MPKKSRYNLGYRSKAAEGMRKKREDPEYAEKEREETRERLARRREDEGLREQKRLQDAEYYKSKARSRSKSGARVDKLKEQQLKKDEHTAKVKENWIKVCYIHSEKIRWSMLSQIREDIWADLGSTPTHP